MYCQAVISLPCVKGGGSRKRDGGIVKSKKVPRNQGLSAGVVKSTPKDVLIVQNATRKITAKPCMKSAVCLRYGIKAKPCMESSRSDVCNQSEGEIHADA